MKIQESSKLIAEFMGAEIIETYLKPNKMVDHYLMDMGQDRVMNERYYADTTMKYHKSWDWIMPVVYKISEMHDQLTYIIAGHIFEDIKCDLYNVDLEAVYSNVVNFILLYNRDDETGQYFKEYKNNN